MKKFFGRGSLILLALFAVYLLLLWGEWLPPVSEQQRADIAFMEQPSGRVAGQVDAFPRMHLMVYAIPEAEFAGVWAADQAKLTQLQATREESAFVSSAEGKYEKTEVDTSSLCVRDTPSCLAFVRENADAARATVTQHAAFLARTQALRAADHARYGFKASFASPLPPLQWVGPMQTTSAALRFADGNTDAALDSVCQDLASWRRLRSHTDILIVDMIGVAFGMQLSRLLADMVAELPPGVTLPASCTAAMAPVEAAEFAQCDQMKADYRLMASAIADVGTVDALGADLEGGWFLRVLGPLAINQQSSKAAIASYAAGTCRYSENFPTTGPLDNPADWREPNWMETIFDPVGSMLTSIAVPNYDTYVLRARDFEASLQTLRTIIWMRGQPDPAAAFAQRPAQLQTPQHSVTFDAPAQALTLTRLEQRAGQATTLVWPLAGSRFVPPAASTEAPQ